MTNELQNALNPSAAGLNVLVAYDNLVSAIKAMNLCDRLAQHFKPVCPLALSFWSLAALGVPLLGRAAADEAAQTNLLVVAVNGDETLPPSIRNWVSRSARRLRYHAGALVAQFHGILPMNQEISPAYECLKHIADDSGLGFFSEVVNSGDEKPDAPTETIREQTPMVSPVWGAGLPYQMKSRHED